MTDTFKCKKCGKIVSEDDYDWKVSWIYWQLKKQGLCEECMFNKNLKTRKAGT